MKLSHVLRAIALIVCTVFEPAHAADNAAFALFEKGNYLAAAKAGAAEGTAASLALAARATLADATLREAPCLECLQNAEALARRAVAADPNNMEGHIHLAVSLGYQARIIGTIRARFARFPEQAREGIETALRLAPNSHWALSAAGGFNIEVVRSGGRFLGSLLYGASFENGVSFFNRAITADPENPLIKLQYALALTGYSFDARRAEITAVLDASVRAMAGNVYEEAMRQRAGRLLSLLNQNKRDEYLVLARRYQGFPGLMTDLVYKVLRRSEWTAAQAAGTVSGSPADARDGFIHLSAAHQVRGVCDRHFAGESDLVLLSVAADRLGPALKWEASHKGEAFPHLYGTLPLALVQSIAEIRPGRDGRMMFPPEIP